MSVASHIVFLGHDVVGRTTPGVCGSAPENTWEWAGAASGPDGFYAMQAKPGSYQVRPSGGPQGKSAPSYSPSVSDATVADGSATTANFQLLAGSELQVHLTPQLPAGKVVPVGRKETISAKVTAVGGPVSAVSLGKGLVASSAALKVLAAPSGLSGFSLPRGGSRTFVFGVQAATPGKVTLSLDASGRTSSGALVQGSGQLALTVGEAGLVVNTTSDAPDDPKALAEVLPQCVTDLNAPTEQCSLRAAIQVANERGADETIDFDIPGAGVPRIAPLSPLPAVTASATIDGTNQPGGWVELLGASAGAGSGIALSGPSSTVRGLVINGFAKGYGIWVGDKSAGDVIAGDRIGSDPTGEVAVPNGTGVGVAAPGTTIGGTSGTRAGTCAGDCDLVSGNYGPERRSHAGSRLGRRGRPERRHPRHLRPGLQPDRR
jgi:hypothetical protein